MSHTIHAIWVRFTPYLTAWAEEEFGTGILLGGHRILELRTLQGVKQALRGIVEEDDNLAIENKMSLSQLGYEVVSSVLNARTCNENIMERYGGETINAFLPVHVPDFLQVDGGAIRPFSRLMQLAPGTAKFLANQVYHEFWAAIRNYDQSMGIGSFRIDKDMLESFCEDNNIPPAFIDDLRRQYQRLKQQGYFNKKS